MPEFEWQFTLVLLTNGIMIGLMYALIALGFVLIYKATDAINFAQGEFVMFAGFIAAGAAEILGAPFWVSALLSVSGMVLLGFDSAFQQMVVGVVLVGAVGLQFVSEYLRQNYPQEHILVLGAVIVVALGCEKYA